MLPFVRFRFAGTVQTPLVLPPYAGSTLRGVFGRALRAAGCSTGLEACAGCAERPECVYARVFEPAPREGLARNSDSVPPPYVIEPPMDTRPRRPGEPLLFHMVLFGPAIADITVVTQAWRRALAAGFGEDNRGTVRLETVEPVDAQGVPVTLRQAIAQSTWQESAPVAAVTLRFLSPLRIQEQGKILGPDSLTPRHLLAGLWRRQCLMQECHSVGDPVPGEHMPSTESITQSLVLQRAAWSRRSSRQGRKMEFDGWIGDWTLRGELAPWMPLLHAGQWLHVGKSTVFGLGRYRLQ